MAGHGDAVEPPDYRRLFEASTELHLVLDPNLLIVAATDAYLAATMTERSAIVGRHVFEVFPDNPDDPGASGLANARASFDRVQRDLVPDTMAVQKHDIRRPPESGGGFEVRYWSAVNTPVLGPDRALRYIVHRVEDVTEFVRIKQRAVANTELTSALQARATRMEAEIYVRSQELQAANQRLREIDRVRSSFISRMSHELRTPLNAVLGFTQLLRLGPLDDEQTEAVEQILRGGDHLLGLIDDVLDIARIDAGKLNLSIEAVGVADVAASAIEMVWGAADRRGIPIAIDGIDDTVFVVADRQRLLQVLINLLSNAVKYNRPGGQVVVRAAAEGDTHLRLSVDDDGIGIAFEDLDRIFEPFERLGAASSDIEGAGVGLTVTRALVERMGGTIGVTSRAGEGSSFWVELPRIAGTTVEIEGAADPRQRRVEPITVVYIEDNLANLQLVEHVLRRRGSATLHPARDGRSGLELVERERPDVVLLDLHLPDLDGASVLRKLREDPATSHVPIVVISADATAARRAQLEDAGAAAFLAKPVGVDELLVVLDAVRARTWPQP